MLHISPALITSSPPAFNPIAYIAYSRASGVKVSARVRDGQRSVVWDIGEAHLHHTKPVDDPRLDVAADPEAYRKIYEVLRAEAWIAGARACGLVVFPWKERAGDKIVMTFGQEMDGPRDFSAGTRRFLRHPAVNAADECRKGVVFEVLCADLGVDPDDVDLCSKVDEIMARRQAS